ncbi:small-conductance mechanosensitive channel [Halanaerobium sp. DL-01]|uniref:mechanosensitive ion channel family protein n=1 Tax=Halanaerobium sp. DL-01 TaxID=1653064 RepID=UPI000DF43C7F|nr:mechanosensitive ion channel family protein [Halanaerobium sp. DL-01]RCW88047.1 small-conductance mechanosensitive channel [Halanaerobium sp. DL-01]
MNNLRLSSIILTNSLFDYLTSAAIIIIGYIFIKIFDRVFFTKICQLVDRISSSFSELFQKIIKKRGYALFYIILLYLSLSQLNIMKQINRVINSILLILSVYFTVLIIIDVILFFLKKYWRKKVVNEEQQKVFSASIFFIKVIIWFIALLFILDNLNIEITGLMTGLGIGGIAVAFAAQTILADIFNYFTIFFDKPFDVGDFIIVGDYKGTIEHIGIKTTRIRSLSGEQLVISNTDLMNSRINNYKRMQRRRINFSFGVTYDTPLEKLKQIPEMVESIIKDIDKTEFVRAHFSEYGNFSLIHQVVYFINDSDYKVYMDIQQTINFKLRELFDQSEIRFAFPTQTIHLVDKLSDRENYYSSDYKSADINKEGSEN